jgi:hypothetical protein
MVVEQVSHIPVLTVEMSVMAGAEVEETSAKELNLAEFQAEAEVRRFKEMTAIILALQVQLAQLGEQLFITDFSLFLRQPTTCNHLIAQ